MATLPEKDQQIIDAHTGLIHRVVIACRNRDMVPDLEEILAQAEQNGWIQLVAALRKVLAGNRSETLLNSLDDEDRVIVSCILRGLQNPDTLPDLGKPVDGSMAAGTSFDNWFGFSGLEVASSIIGLATDGSGGTTAFTAGMATPPAPQGPEVSPVPLPAAGWLMIVGMGGLFAARRRSTA